MGEKITRTTVVLQYCGRSLEYFTGLPGYSISPAVLRKYALLLGIPGNIQRWPNISNRPQSAVTASEFNSIYTQMSVDADAGIHQKKFVGDFC